MIATYIMHEADEKSIKILALKAVSFVKDGKSSLELSIYLCLKMTLPQQFVNE